MKENELIKCKCNCGETLLKYDKYGREREYISGHNNRGKKLFAKGERVCLIHPTHETALNELGNEHWFRYKEGYICSKCAMKILYYPKHKERDKKRVRFKNTRPRLDKEYKKEKCDWCSKKIGDKYINSKGKESTITALHTHHIEYHEDDILKDTIQICPQCHAIESAKTRKLKDMSDRVCFRCKRTYEQLKSIIKNYRRWTKIEGKGWLCDVCASPYKKGQPLKQ